MVRKIKGYILLFLTVSMLSGCAYTDWTIQIKTTSFETSEINQKDSIIISKGKVKVHDSYGVLLAVEVSEDTPGKLNIVYSKDKNKLEIFQDWRKILLLKEDAVRDEDSVKKLESSLKNMLLVLTGVTAISVALLAYVNELTKGPIAEANAKTLNEALKKVLPEFTNNPVAESDTIFSEKDGKKNVDFIVYPAKNGEELVGTAVEAKSMGFGGELKVLVGFNAEGKIYNYSLLAHTETPGLGSKADKWFGAYDPAKGEKAVSHEESTKSILGMNPGEAPLTVSKDGGAVDAITASTITSRAFLNAVNAAYQAYKAEGGEVNGVTGASQKAKGADADAADAATGATIKVELTDSVSAK